MKFQLQIDGDYSSYFGEKKYDALPGIHRRAGIMQIGIIFRADPRVLGWVQVYLVGNKEDIARFKLAEGRMPRDDHKDENVISIEQEVKEPT